MSIVSCVDSDIVSFFTQNFVRNIFYRQHNYDVAVVEWCHVALAWNCWVLRIIHIKGPFYLAVQVAERK